MEFENLIKLIDTVSASNLTGFKYEAAGVNLSMKKGGEKSLPGGVKKENSVSEAFIPEQENISAENAEGNIIASPLVGTYYCAPAEDAEAFVSVGDAVKKGQTLAIIEAMKLMNEIESEYSGTVAEIFVKNGQPVEYGQPLFRIC
ncbi:MAG: acetyl-CoA carboxylase biotin carboxyl carrier protein [Lachnospiraceae bacterium]